MALDDAELDRRILALRTGELTVSGLTPGATVTWRLVRHGFPFGTAVAASPLGVVRTKRSGKTSEVDSPADQQRFLTILDQHFSCLVAENEMKWYANERADGTPDFSAAEAMLAKTAHLGMSWRGHCLGWGVPHWQPDWLKAIAALPRNELESRIRGRINAMLGTFSGRIRTWDVWNEVLAEDIFGRALGFPAGDAAAYHRWAEEAAPGCRWFINEYTGLQDGTPERIAALAERLLAAKAPLHGIGDQAHYHRPVPDAATLWSQLDILARPGLPIHITEFDLGYAGMTPQDHAEQLARFYKVCFAHPAVEAIVMWGFWERRHWRPETALWRTDWSITPAGEAYVGLVSGAWHTQGAGQAGADGTVSFKGFYGTYTVSAGDRNASLTLSRTVPKAALPAK
jgi:endo-1,4-beta-xylanase